ncbi:MAG: hypothetical protein A3J38_02075 [Gammaproteobacteria bacterium RIFCSPHIGHO2_12_FULL_45_9]|nr:MAG: hypothetical protein A3J38_02075 [Gammaproteobacteria bacterium RIFCSPHIGHO2_12_FULL_45_9]
MLYGVLEYESKIDILPAIPALIIVRSLGHFLLFLCVVNAQKTTIFSGDGGLPGGSSAALPPGCKQKLCFCLAFNQLSNSCRLRRELL